MNTVGSAFIDKANVFSREFRLVLCCACTEMSIERARAIRELINQGIDWEQLVQIAGRQGMLPLTYFHLSREIADDIPSAYHDQLEQYFHVNSARSQFLSGELLQLMELFEKHGIRAIPYKGVTLAKQLYGRLELRESGDMDIIIRKSDIDSLTRLATEQGYSPTSVSWRGYVNTRGMSHLVLQHAKHNTTLELHWEIAAKRYCFDDDIDRIWSRLESMQFGKKSLLAFNPRDHLFLLSLHGAKHVWNRLKWLCDIAQLLRTYPDEDWGPLIDRSSQLGQRRMVLLAFALSRELLDAKLSASVARAVAKERGLQRNFNAACAAMMAESEGRRGISMRYLTFPYTIRERFRDRFRYSLTTSTRLFVFFPNTLFKLAEYIGQSTK